MDEVGNGNIDTFYDQAIRRILLDKKATELFTICTPAQAALDISVRLQPTGIVLT